MRDGEVIGYLGRRAGRRAGRRVDPLSIAIVQPTDWYADGQQNIFDACPGAILRGSLLVPPCGPDEFRGFESNPPHGKNPDTRNTEEHQPTRIACARDACRACC
jgi:hypothetical protein